MLVYHQTVIILLAANVAHAWSLWSGSALGRSARTRSTPHALDKKMPNTVRQVMLNGNRTALLVGCLHGSNSAVQDVTDTIATAQPQAVVLELCSARYKRLQRDQASFESVIDSQSSSRTTEWASIVQAATRDGGPVQGLVAGLLASSQVFQPSSFIKGAEFSAAIRSARALNETSCNIVLGDTDADQTMRRAAYRTPQLESVGRLIPTLAQALGVSLRQGEALKILKVVLMPRSRIAEDAASFFVGVSLLLAGISVPISAFASAGNAVAASDPSSLYVAAIEFVAIRPVVDVLLIYSGTLLLSHLVDVILSERNNMMASSVLQASALTSEGSNLVVVLGLLHVNGVADELVFREATRAETTCTQTTKCR